MKHNVHIANTDVEFEFANPSLSTLEQSWNRHPLCLQLQFLPLLYAEPEDIVAVTALPSLEDLAVLQQSQWAQKGLPQLALLHDIEPFQNKTCLSWGPSRQVQTWAESRHMSYLLPKDWDTICLINSKAFSFRYTCLSQAALLHNEQELHYWLKNTPGAKVLKTCFGLSGHGNRHLADSSIPKEILNFCKKEWQHKRPIIGEPWLDRTYDFSTQWYIHPNQSIEWIGATRFETDARGNYLGTLAGPEKLLFASFDTFLKQHRHTAEKALEDIVAMGFFGSVGIDALLYRHPHTHSICLYPLVEINGRQTMSLVALRLQQRLCPHQILRLSFQQNSPSLSPLLPNQLVNMSGKTIRFQRQLTINLNVNI